MKTKICCISRQTIKKFFERRTNSFTTCYSKLYASHDKFIHELFTHAFASMSGIISWKYFHVLGLDLREKRYAEPDKIILNRTKTIIHNTILPNDEINNCLEWKERSQPISSRPVAASRFSNFKRCQIDNYMHVYFWLKRLLCRFRKTEQNETSSGGKMNNKSSG